MTQIEALKELLAKVEAGEEYATMGHTLMCQRSFPKPADFDGSREAYAKSDAQMAILAWRNGSMDAALSLFDAVLPEWFEYHVSKYWCSASDSSGSYDVKTEGNPARALLIAILKAKIAELET